MARKRSVTIDIVTDEKDAVRGLQRLKGQAEVTESGFTKFGRGVSVAVGAVAAGAVTSFAVDMARLGTQNEQVLARFSTVFGESAGKVEAWAESNKAAFGVSQTELQGMAAATGDLLVPLGFARDEVADMAPQVLEMANAFSVFTGGQISAKDAAEKVNKALLGEREGLKELGVVVMDADVQARLAAKGQQELTGAAKDQAKALATLELVQERGADALNQYREQGAGALSETRELESIIGDLRDKLASLAADGLIPAAGAVADFIGNLQRFAEEGTRRTPRTIDRLREKWLELGDTVVDQDALLQSMGDSQVQHLIPALETMGITLDDLTDSLRNGGDGLKAMIDRLEEEKQALSEGGRQRTATNKLIKELREEFLTAALSVNAHWRELEKEEKAEREAADARQEMIDKSKTAAKTIDSTTDAVEAAEQAAKHMAKADEEAAAAAEELARQNDLARAATENRARAQQAAADPVFRMIEATRNLEEKLARVAELEAAGMKGTREYEDALWEAVEAQGGYNVALGELGTNKHDAIKAFEELAESADLPREMIDLLVAAIGRYNTTPVAAKKFQTPSGGFTVETQTGFVAEAFQHGGVVSGRRGQPRLIVAHGGERFLGSPGTHAARGNGASVGGRLVVPVTVQIDGRTVARQTVTYMNEELARLAERDG